MLERTYYSVQTSLTEELQREVLKNHYLYVALEFDPTDNHDTSNPRLLTELWSRVATGKATAAERTRWAELKMKLRTILLDKFADGEIDWKGFEKGSSKIAKATMQAASPVLFVIPRDAEGFEVLPGDSHEGYENEAERLIPNLKPKKKYFLWTVLR